jgi:hypothetical protein
VLDRLLGDKRGQKERTSWLMGRNGCRSVSRERNATRLPLMMRLQGLHCLISHDNRRSSWRRVDGRQRNGSRRPQLAGSHPADIRCGRSARHATRMTHVNPRGGFGGRIPAASIYRLP